MTTLRDILLNIIYTIFLVYLASTLLEVVVVYEHLDSSVLWVLRIPYDCPSNLTRQVEDPTRLLPRFQQSW